jgi:quercetin dioxygenase-like cupin family protein
MKSMLLSLRSLPRRRPAPHSLLLLAVLPLGFAASLGFTLFGSGESARADAAPPVTQVLARSQFPDELSAFYLYRTAGSHPTDVIRLNSGSDLVVVKVTIPAGSSVDWHTHPGPGTIAVAQGTLTLTWAHDCMPHDYAAGQAAFDSPNMVMRADNFGSTDVIAYVTFLGIPPGPASIPAPDPGC